MFLAYYYGGSIVEILLIVGALAISGLASLYIKINYNKYKEIQNKKKYSGFDTAREILDNNGLKDVLILEVQGELTDHYDPKKKVVSLSTDIYHGTSIASVSVAAHECGHAIQDKEGYFFLRLRTSIYPVVHIATAISYYIILIGFIAEALDLIYLAY